MDICLHLGAHRTGTTTFQRFMEQNSEVLLRRGISAVGPSKTRTGLLNGVIKNPEFATAEDDRLARRAIGRVKLHIAQAAESGVQNFVLSEENLLGTMSQNMSSCYLYSQVRERLARVAPAFDGRQLTVGVGIRSYDAHWSSQLAFRIKGGSALPREGKLDRLSTQPRRWRHVVEDISLALPEAKIIVWAFESWVGQPAQLLAAMTCRPLPAQGLRPIEWANRSHSVQELRAILSESGNAGAAKKLAGQMGRYNPFPAMHRAKLKEDYRADIDWLEAGADGRATYLIPTGGTSGGYDMTRGNSDDIEERHMAGAR